MEAAQEGRIYRVGMALPSAETDHTANLFMNNNGYPDDADRLLTDILVDKEDKCMHLNSFDGLSKVAGEAEWVFPPYSAFQVVRFDWVKKVGVRNFWKLTIKALPDNKLAPA